MKTKTLCLGSAVFAAMLVAGGCVTKGTYEQLETAKNQEITQLQAERSALQNERSQLQSEIGGLSSQRSALEQQKSTLEQQKSTLEQQQAELRQQVEALEQQKNELLSASRQTQSQYDALVGDLKEELKKGQLQVRQYQNMLTVDVAEQLFFDSGQASLKDSGKEVLRKVGDTLKAYDGKIIRVVGHTDNVPIAKAHQHVYPSNWELSVARATNVVRYLQEVGIPPERMVASGRGEFAPVAENETPEGRKKNRRIEITLIDRNLMEEVNAQTARVE